MSWPGCYKQLCRLQKVLNNDARVGSGSKKYDHITPVLKDLRWLSIRKRIEIKILLYDFQMHARMCPSIFEGIVSQTSQYKDSNIKH